MLCPHCSSANLDDALACANCGKQLIVDSSSDSHTPKYVGVGGWLAFFIVTVLIIGPVLSIPGLLREFRLLVDGAGLSRGRWSLVVTNFGVTLFMRGFGIYAGVKLWKIAQNAVRIAKRYLLCWGVYWAIVLSLTAVTGVMGAISKDEIWLHVEHSAVSLFGAALWYSYFEVSDRVAATYPLLTAPSQ